LRFAGLNPQLALTVYDIKHVPAISNDRRLSCLIAYGPRSGERSTIPTLVHLPSDGKPNTASTPIHQVHMYSTSSPHFVLPHVVGYDPGHAALAHSRSLVFLRKWLGGPLFDLEAIWDEHCYFEFDIRSVAKTMGTMVVS
jgi:carboxymethylenebutenolidase